MVITVENAAKIVIIVIVNIISYRCPLEVFAAVKVNVGHKFVVQTVVGDMAAVGVKAVVHAVGEVCQLLRVLNQERVGWSAGTMCPRRKSAVPHRNLRGYFRKRSRQRDNHTKQRNYNNLFHNKKFLVFTIFIFKFAKLS